MAHVWSLWAMNQREEEQGSVTYTTDQEDNIGKILVGQVQ